MKQQIKGGKGDKLNPKDVDSNQLQMGIKIEMEHTKSAKLAKEIALDHLAEDPQYYSKLKKAKLEHKMDKNKILKLITEIAMQEMARIPTLYQLTTTDANELEKLIPADLKRSGIVKNIIDFFTGNGNTPSSTVSVAKAFGYAAQQPVNTQFQRLKAAGVLQDKGLAFPKKEKPAPVGQGRKPSDPTTQTDRENVAFIINKMKNSAEPNDSYKSWFIEKYGQDNYDELASIMQQRNATNLKDEYAELTRQRNELLKQMGLDFDRQKGRKPKDVSLPPTQDLGNFEKDEEGNDVPLGENQPKIAPSKPQPGIAPSPDRRSIPVKRPNRRPLTPPDPDTMPTPKNENGMVKKIVDRYKNLK